MVLMAESLNSSQQACLVSEETQDNIRGAPRIPGNSIFQAGGSHRWNKDCDTGPPCVDH